MRLFAVRRLVSLLVVLMLVFGVGGQGAFAVPMGGKVEASAAMPMPNGADCQGCGGDHASMAVGACFALCAGTIALPAGFVAAPDAAAERLTAAVAAAGVGISGPPDPFPPRSLVLS